MDKIPDVNINMKGIKHYVSVLEEEHSKRFGKEPLKDGQAAWWTYTMEWVYNEEADGLVESCKEYSDEMLTYKLDACTGLAYPQATGDYERYKRVRDKERILQDEKRRRTLPPGTPFVPTPLPEGATDCKTFHDLREMLLRGPGSLPQIWRPFKLYNSKRIDMLLDCYKYSNVCFSLPKDKEVNIGPVIHAIKEEKKAREEEVEEEKERKAGKEEAKKKKSAFIHHGRNGPEGNQKTYDHLTTYLKKEFPLYDLHTYETDGRLLDLLECLQSSGIEELVPGVSLVFAAEVGCAIVKEMEDRKEEKATHERLARSSGAVRAFTVVPGGVYDAEAFDLLRQLIRPDLSITKETLETKTITQLDALLRCYADGGALCGLKEDEQERMRVVIQAVREEKKHKEELFKLDEAMTKVDPVSTRPGGEIYDWFIKLSVSDSYPHSESFFYHHSLENLCAFVLSYQDERFLKYLSEKHQKTKINSRKR